MKGVVAWFAANGVAANLLMALILGLGILTLPQIREEVFPELTTETISITMLYPGAAPEEVEEGICVRIEEAIQSLEGIDRITSTAAENVGTVIVEVLEGEDVRELLDEVKSRVDAIDTFPEEAEEPVIQEVTIRRQVINVAVSGRAGEKTIKKLAEQVRDEISALPGITQVELANARPYEVSIEVSEQDLRRWGLSFDRVAQAIRRSSLDLPGGAVKTRAGEVLLRTKGQAYDARDFENLVLLTRPDGSRILLGDVARVVDGFAETDQTARFDGNPAVLVQVFRVGDQSALDIAGRVKAYVAEAQPRMPEGISLTTWQDDSKVLQSRLNLLLRNGRAGLALVVITLALFLRLGLAFWVSLGIPISFLGALSFMPGLDVSINLISLFAFIVVLGIVVDDAIVVGENIYSRQEAGDPPLEASVRGASEVLTPVVFGVLTSVAAFSPLLQVPGSTGRIMQVIPLIVIPVLMFSLVESLLILPNHLTHSQARSRKPRRGLSPAAPWRRFQNAFAGGLRWVIQRLYLPSLAAALRWRYLTLATGVAILLLAVGLVGGGFLRFSFLPDVEADNVVALLTMPQGTPVEVTAEAVRRLENSALELRREIDGGRPSQESVFRHLLASIGDQPFRTDQRRGGGDLGASFSGAHLGEVNIELAPSEERDIGSSEIARRWRELTGPIPDAVELTFSSSLFSTGEAVNVQLAGPDLDRLRGAAEELKERLARYPGVFDIADSFRAGKAEVKLEIKPAAEAFGLSLADLARQVRQAFYGEEAQRIQRGRDEVKVMVRYPRSQRESLGDLESMRIRTPAGGEIPFSNVAEYRLGRGFSTIRRVDRQRAVNVTADVDETRITANEVLADLEARVLPELLAGVPGTTYSLEGEQREQRETLGGLFEGFAIALLLIYTLLAIPLRSYVQPLLIMSAIPFGLVGAVVGHIVMGQDLTILSGFGIVALAGVVVNDSLVLIDRVNQGRRQGGDIGQALLEAGASRFRPILLTSLTTFAGLTPLLLEKSLQAQFLIPMAISLGFGVLLATGIILVLVPSGYWVLDDCKRLFYRIVPGLSERHGGLVSGKPA